MSVFVIVGAGVAGLAAAARLRARGRRAVVIEASHRIGGRAWTTRPRELGGLPFDHGAVWLHAADQNPLTPLARSARFALLDADATRVGRTGIGDRWATGAERNALDAAWTAFEAAAERLLAATGADATLADVADRMPDDPWALTVEAWEGPIIAAAPARRLSLEDWRRNRLHGRNLMLEQGLGTFVEQTLGEGCDVRLGTAALAVRETPAGVAVETTAGTIDAERCIVTVSTGVLASGAIRFSPALPERTRDAIDALPMGHAVKVALRADGPDRLDLPAFCTVDRRIEDRREGAVLINAWPFGRDHIVAWIGADAAEAIAGERDEAAGDLVRARLRALFGARADRLFGDAKPVVTHWAEDALFRGAYAYARRGKADARAALGEPVWAGRLLFAGEATHPSLAGTVGGAYLSGQRAADRAMDGPGGGRGS